jgi:hypothetical protein
MTSSFSNPSMPTCRARYTSAIPPMPIFLSSWYLPNGIPGTFCVLTTATEYSRSGASLKNVAKAILDYGGVVGNDKRMPHRYSRDWLLTLALIGLLWAPAAQALKADNPHLREARQLFKQLNYAEVVHKLEMALTVPGNTQEDLVEIYTLLGTVHVILGNTEAARKAFEELITLSPNHRLDPDLSPKILDVFRQVKQTFKPPARVRFRGKPAIGLKPNHPPRMEVTLDDESGAVAQVELWYRSNERAGFKSVKLARAGLDRFVGEIPLDETRIPPTGLRVEYYLNANSDSNRTLTRLGSDRQPLDFTVLPVQTGQPPGPGAERPETMASAAWYQSWWFWSLVGVVAIGAGVGIYLGTRPEDVPMGSLGEIELSMPSR